MSTANDMFGSPAAADGVKWGEHLGRLLLIQPHAQERIPTAYGESDCVRADVIVLDGDQAGDVHGDVLVFPKVLQSQIRPNIGTGKFTLGRLGQGAAKPGQSAPWRLDDPTDADKTIARAHLEKTAKIPF